MASPLSGARSPEHNKPLTTMNNDPYTRLGVPSNLAIAPCPVCGAAPELYQFMEKPEGPATKVVMCSNGDAIGPQIKDQGLIFEGCLLFMPPEAFYRSRVVEAVNYWNEYATALHALRQSRG